MNSSIQRLSKTVTELSRPGVHYTMVVFGLALVWFAANDDVMRIGPRFLQMSTGLFVIYNQLTIRSVISPLMHELQRLNTAVESKNS